MSFNKHLRLLQRSYPAHAIGEYAIVLSVIALASIGVLIAFGGTLQNTLLNFANGIESKPIAIQPANTLPDTSSKPNNNGNTNNPQERMIAIKLNNGSSILLPDYPMNLQTAIETNGANGATDLLAIQISTLANKLLESGEINETQANQLQALANQGFLISSIEANLSSTIEGNNYTSAPNELKFTHNGQTVDLETYSELIGVSTNTGTAVQGPAIQKLNQLLEAAKNNGALANPHIQDYISAITSDIVKIANGVETTLDKHEKSPSLADSWKVWVASEITNLKSDQIYKTGGGSSNGISCAN